MKCWESMRLHAIVFSVLMAVVMAVDMPSWMDDVNDWRVTLGRDATTDDYRERGLELPVIAEPLIVVDGRQSYIAKINCLGCPSRNRLPPISEETCECGKM